MSSEQSEHGASPTTDAVCALCFPEARVIDRIGAELLVVVQGGVVSLMTEPAHSGDQLVTFLEPPTPDPVTPEIDARAEELEHGGQELGPELQAAFDAGDLWVDAAQEAMAPLAAGPGGLRSCWQLVEDLRGAGYDPQEDGYAEVWLYNRIGAAVAADRARSSILSPTAQGLTE